MAKQDKRSDAKQKPTTARRSRRDDSNSNSSSNFTVTTRSLRNTPGRLRARCEMGRAASDTSSGISDDVSSSSSDSGIETSGGEYEAGSNSSGDGRLARGVERLNLDEGSLKTETPPMAPTRERLKLTLRMKRSPVLDEVLEVGHALREEGEAGSASFKRKREPEYEVLRMEGVQQRGEEDPDAVTEKRPRADSPDSELLDSKSRNKRKNQGEEAGAQQQQQHSPLKRLKLVLGNTVSTIHLPS